MHISNLTAGLGRLVSDNASALLTAGGVAGVIGTAILSARAGGQAKEARILQELDWEKEDTRVRVAQDGVGGAAPLTTLDKVKVTCPYFILPAVCGSAAIAAIILSNRVSARQAAALAAAYGLSQSQLEEYKAKVLETVGVSKEKKIREGIAQDQISENPPKGQVLVLGAGKVLCYDSLSGRYFQSTVDTIRKAENSVNSQLFHYQICSLSHFYEEVGLDRTELSDGLGWNMVTADHGQLEVILTAVKTEDEEPCLSLGYNILPKHGYEQLH